VDPEHPEPPPDIFADLHLNDIVSSVTTGREVYDLAPFFSEPLRDVRAITYRQEVFHDLEDSGVLEVIRSFAREMQTVRARMRHAGKAHYRFDRERWFLGAATAYGAALTALGEGLMRITLRSAGLTALREYVAGYAASDGFATLVADTRRVRATLDGVHYRLRIHGPRVTVARYRPEPDYSAEVLQTFEKFKQGAGKAYHWDFDETSNMNHVEAAILDRVERLYPDPFRGLHDYADRHHAFLDPTVSRFDREVQFYVGYLDAISRLREAGLPFCYPTVTPGVHAIHGRGVFDLALAASLVRDRVPVIVNDVDLSGAERVLVVTGPNQGGKTTFARTIGQVHHLARIGVPVPGEELGLPLVDRIFTHFERAEQVEDLTSKLEDDLRRIHRIVGEATPSSLLIMNESFSSTTVGDQLFIGRRVLRSIIERGLLCVVVTFLDELAALDSATVSMVSGVDPQEPARRTFRIERRPADGLAYAMAIAEKHRLTYPSVKARLAR
jgi:DNA mismatch repair protein MutS